MFKFIHSIRFRVWFLFIGFTSAILIFLYINQVVLVPIFYDYMKTRESISTVNILKKNWGTNNFDDLFTMVRKLADEQLMYIEVVILKTDTGVPLTYSQDPSGAYSFSVRQIPINEIYQEVNQSRTGIITEKFKSDSGMSYLFLLARVGEPDDINGYIKIQNYIEPLGNALAILQNQFFMSASILLCVAFILSAFVVVSISNPIIIISRNANKLSTGDFRMDIKPGAYAEIKTLTDNLNKASNEIAKTENLRKDLIANVSHDLKTPLTMIKAYAEMIRDLSGNNPEKREKHLQVIIDESDRLNNLVVDMLDLSKIQNGVAELKRVSFNFSQNLDNVLNRFYYLIETQSYKIITEISPDIYTTADITKLEQAVYNLIINAINYTGEDKNVIVRLFQKNQDTARFEVHDTGKGISPNELPYIWERYYKANKSEFYKRAAVGTGLGLSIVKGVFDLHGFVYGADSTIGVGSTFWFEFPTL